MTEEDQRESTIWAYVHGELSEAERKDFERRLESDATLAEGVRKARTMHRRLGHLLPLAEKSEAELEEEILADWERSRTTEAPEAQPGFGAFLSSLADRVGRLLAPMPALRLAAVAAMLLLVAVGLRNYTAHPLSWQATEMTLAPAYRGEGRAPEAPYTREDIEEFVGGLRAEIRYLYERAAPPRSAWARLLGRRRWALHGKVEVLPTARLMVELEAVEPQRGEVVKSWTEHFESPDDPSNRRAPFCTKVVYDLLALEAGRRPGEDATGQ